MKLTQLQNSFVNSLYKKSSAVLLSEIKPGKAPAEELFDIYRNNLFANLTNVLRLTYPRICDLMGEKKFKKFSYEFIAQSPSNSGNLDEYGEDFSKFLVKKNEKFFADLAKLEWLKQTAYLASDAKVLDIEKLKNLSEEKLFDVKFQLHPSCFLMVSAFNLLASRKQMKPTKNSKFFLIYRHGLEVVVQKISADEFNFLNGVTKNLTLFAIYKKYKINVGKVLQKSLSNGIISGFML
jgi:hypothetical protein